MPDVPNEILTYMCETLNYILETEYEDFVQYLQEHGEALGTPDDCPALDDDDYDILSTYGPHSDEVREVLDKLKGSEAKGGHIYLAALMAWLGLFGDRSYEEVMEDV